MPLLLVILWRPGLFFGYFAGVGRQLASQPLGGDRARAVSHCQCRIFRCICACTREISALTKTDLSTQPAMDPVAMQAITKLAVTGPGPSRGTQHAVIGPVHTSQIGCVVLRLHVESFQ